MMLKASKQNTEEHFIRQRSRWQTRNIPLLPFLSFHGGWCHILTEDVLPKTGSGTFSGFWNALLFGIYRVFWNTSWFWNLAGPSVPFMGMHDLSSFEIASRMPIPYYFSLCFIRVGAKSWPGGFPQNWFWNIFWVLKRLVTWNLPFVL